MKMSKTHTKKYLPFILGLAVGVYAGYKITEFIDQNLL